MRAGQLDRDIRIDAYVADGVDDFGTPAEMWTELATVPAQMVQASTAEFIKGGAVDETSIIFRIRYLDGVTNACRVIYAGDIYNVKETKEIGRRKGLDIRCLRLSGNN